MALFDQIIETLYPDMSPVDEPIHFSVIEIPSGNRVKVRIDLYNRRWELVPLNCSVIDPIEALSICCQQLYCYQPRLANA